MSLEIYISILECIYFIQSKLYIKYANIFILQISFTKMYVGQSAIFKSTNTYLSRPLVTMINLHVVYLIFDSDCGIPVLNGTYVCEGSNAVYLFTRRQLSYAVRKFTQMELMHLNVYVKP